MEAVEFFLRWTWSSRSDDDIVDLVFSFWRREREWLLSAATEAEWGSSSGSPLSLALSLAVFSPE
jgi:hypothetical protein